jgi:Tfp pilus assembly protein PilF
MKSTGRWLRLLAVALVLGLIAGGGYGLFRYYTRGAEADLEKGEAAYADGLRAFEGKDYNRAAMRFDEAVLLSLKALDHFEGMDEKLRDKPQEEIDKARELHGRVFWLKARALRGLAFARTAVEGQPLPAGPTTASGEPGEFDVSRVSFRRIQDRQLREEAIQCMRLAALRLPTAAEIQKQALFTELDLEPPYWPAAQTFANNRLRLDGNDARALQLLARFEYEQPLQSASKDSNWVPTTSQKRSRERMLKSRQYLAKLKEIEKPLRWPTLNLEAQVHQWMIQHYRSSLTSKPGEEMQEEQALRTLLFDEDHGALRRADQEPALSSLSTKDIEAIASLHLLALEKVLDFTRRPGKEPEAATSERVLRVFDATMAFCRKFASQDGLTATQLGELADTAVSTAFRAQPFLAKDHPREWSAHLDAVQALVQRAAAKQAGGPVTYIGLAELLNRESKVQGNLGQSVRQQELRTQAVKWIEEGIRIAQARKLPPMQVLPLHELAARLKALATGKRDDVAPHLQAIRESRSTAAQATAFLLEGLFAQREGRLERARDHLEQVLRSGSGKHADKAHMILANLYLALGQPDKALVSLREIERMDAQFDKLSDEERAWLREFIRDPVESAYLQVQAHLATARAKYQFISRQRPDARTLELITKAIAQHEEQVAKLLAHLPELQKQASSPKTDYQLAARHLLVTYYATTDRLERARKELAAIKADHPGSVQVLRQDVGLMTQPTKGDVPPEVKQKHLDQADQRIQEFMANYPTEVSARLFWAQWLATTGRPAQAAAFLENPANFPGVASDPRLKQALAVLQLNLGETDKVRQLAGELPSGAAADRIAVLVAASDSERQDKLAAALNRYEDTGYFRVYAASVALGRRDYVEAAKSYLQALEYTRVKESARQGLGNALIALANDHPQKARDLAGQMLQDYPSERNLLLAYAYACLLLDDLGNPADPGNQIKDMSSALNALEQVATRDAETPAAGPMVKAQFWSLAGRADRARSEALRALEKNPKHEAALLMAAQLALESGDSGALVTGRRHLQTLLQVNPDSAQGLLLQAQFAEAEGGVPEAIRLYEALLDKQPKLAAGYSSLVELLHRHGPREKAAAWIQKWRTNLPMDLAGLVAEVRDLAFAGRLPDAVRVADKAIEEQLRSVDERQQVTRPGAAAKSDEEKKAERDRVRASTQLLVATAFAQARTYEDAERWAITVLKDQPRAEAAQMLLGDIYLGRLRNETWPFLRPQWARKAHDAYGKVYALQPGHLTAGNNLAWLLANELGDPEKALAIAREVRAGRFSKAPRSGERLPVELLDTFGTIARSLGKPEVSSEMRDLFQAAIKRHSADPRMYLHLGRAYAGLNEKSKAGEMFNTAIAVSKTKSTLPPPQRQLVIQEAELEKQRLKGS